MLTVNKLWTTYIAVTFLEEIALILFIAWQKKQARADGSETFAVLLPRYRHVLHVLILEQLFNGAIGMWFLEFGKTANPPQPVMFISQIIEHTFAEGVLFLLVSKSVGLNAFARSFVFAFLLSLLPAIAWSWGTKWPFQPFNAEPPWSQVNICFYVVQILFHLSIIVVPRSWWVRRPACRIVAFPLFVGQSIALALCFTDHDAAEDSTTGLALFGLYLFFNAAAPIFTCFAFQQDSQYWTGILVFKAVRPATTGAYMPLLGPLDRRTSKALVNSTDDFSECMINFENLIIDDKHVLGQGSGAKVFAGKYRSRIVAVKMLYHAELTEDIVANFRDEVLNLRRLRHKNIVTLIGVCIVPPQFCIVLEFCDRGNLRSFLDVSYSSCSYALLLSICMDCCRAVAFLHSQAPPVIHSDVKSPNFLVSSHGDSVVIKIADLEVSGASAGNQMLPDCPHWLAPEILVGNGRVTKQADVYALAIVLSEVLSGRPPFQGRGNRRAVQAYILAGGRPTIPIMVDPSIAILIEKAWHTDPLRRISAEQLLNAFSILCGPNPMSASSLLFEQWNIQGD
eukprot:m.290871 g.290871  ORF g.290871 m.290871 type:complete len:566 (-) comp55086_c0_seq2:133-1830(-)